MTTTTTTRKTTTRQPVKALSQSADVIKANAAAEKARKQASKKALREATKAEQAAEAVWYASLSEVEQEEVNNGERSMPTPAPVDHRAEDAANALKTAIADAEATGVKLEDMLESMGIDAQGYPAIKVPTLGAPRAPRANGQQPYDGPMLALRQAALAYVTPKNGNPCNGDALATACGNYERAVVVEALIKAMALDGNPYLHLNPGQQSMNLRNKARARITAGTLTIAEVEAALNVAYTLSPAFAAIQAKIVAA